MLKKRCFFLALCCVAAVGSLHARTLHRGRESGYNVESTSTMRIENRLRVNSGRLRVGEKATLEGATGAIVEFTNGRFVEENQVDVELTGTLDINANEITVDGSNFNPASGRPRQRIRLSGSAKLEGLSGRFDESVSLADPASELDLNLATPINTNINLAGGKINLTGDARLSDGRMPRGDGTIDARGNRLSTGGRNLTLGDNLTLRNMSDWDINSKITVTGELTFTGNAKINGNGNVLDLSQGGTIRIRATTTLAMCNITLKGLGLGKLIFEDPTSQLCLSDAHVMLNRDVTFTTGGFYIEGPTKIITKDKILRFDSASSLTVDCLTLEYDTVSFTDKQNIRPFNAAADLNQLHLTLLNNATIRRVASTSGPVVIVNNFILEGLLELHPDFKIFFCETATLDGATHNVFFSCAKEPLIVVDPGKIATFENIAFKAFAPHHINAGAKFIFADNTKIELGQNSELVTTWTFTGACVLNGRGFCLDMSSTAAALVLQQDRTNLLLEDIIIKGLSANKIRCLDNSSSVSFKNVTWIQDDSTTFSLGTFAVIKDLELVGSSTFEYSTVVGSTIFAHGKLKLDCGMSFSYAPKRAHRDLIYMENSSAVLEMKGATLASTVTGLRLTRGTLMLDHKNNTINDGAASASQSIAFGNGSASDDLTVKVMPGANINVLTGRLVYDNTI
ncbi:MAG: hypothetical protein H6679_03795 [Epsilonproteobacteria bacterium]|nr:hypothetical protein [Campylobacterota bacterium]